MPDGQPSAEDLMVLGAIAQEQFKQNPVDLDKLKEDILNCNQLIIHSVDKIDDDVSESIRIMGIALRALVDMRDQLLLYHIIEGDAAEQMMHKMQSMFKEQLNENAD